MASNTSGFSDLVWDIFILFLIIFSIWLSGKGDRQLAIETDIRLDSLEMQLQELKNERREN